MDEGLFFTTEAIGNFLSKYGKGSKTKDYEFIIAVMLKNFCEKQWGVKCKIGFEFKAEYLGKIKDKKTLSLEKIAELFRDGIE